VARDVIADRTGSLHTYVTLFKVFGKYRVDRDSDEFLRAATGLGDGSPIAATLLFSAVFIVLDLPAARVLLQLLALGCGTNYQWVDGCPR
jgi:hypothetical protein